MQYVAMLRASRIVKWYAIALLGSLVLDLISLWQHGSLALQMSGDKNPGIPFAALLTGSVLAPVLLAAFFATGLDAEFQTVAIAWTRPMSRWAIAGRHVLADMVAMLAVWALTLVAILAGVSLLGVWKYVTFGDGSWVRIPLLFGVSLMWYGLVVLVAALLPGRGKAIAGASWAYALFVPVLATAPLPGLLHAIAVGLSYLSPLPYAGTNGGASGSVTFGAGTSHVLIAWLIGIVAIVIGTRIWAHSEVPA